MTFLYTTPGTPTTTALTPTDVAFQWTDSTVNFANPPSLTLHFDGTNGQTTTVDTSGNNHTITLGGSGALRTASPKFGPSCYSQTDASTPGTSFASTPIAAAGNLDVLSGSADFTIEFWCRLDSSTGAFTVLDYGGDQASFVGTQQLYIQIFNTGATSGVQLQALVTDSVSHIAWGSFSVNDAVPASSVWHHVAIVRQSGVPAFYYDGFSIAVAGSASWANYPSSPATPFLTIGRTATVSGGAAFGSVDEFRVTKGAALYTANFTPPTAPFMDPGAPPGYTIFRDGFEFVQVLGVHAYTDFAVNPGETHVYKVAAQDGSDVLISDFSGNLTVLIPQSDGHAFGKFVPAVAYPPFVLANAKGIKPKIYMPLEDTTVRIRQ